MNKRVQTFVVQMQMNQTGRWVDLESFENLRDAQSACQFHTNVFACLPADRVDFSAAYRVMQRTVSTVETVVLL
jgi:hypothetical protein